MIMALFRNSDDAKILSCIRRALSFLLLCTATQVAFAQCLGNEPLKGVNLAGAEFKAKKKPAVLNKDYVYPTNKDIDYVKNIGGNVIRLPFRWERIQPKLLQELDPAELRVLSNTVTQANTRGLCVILDVHNYATYDGEVIGSSAVPVEAFFDLWKRLAAAFPQPEGTIFGLMNEPAKISIAQWAPIAKKTVNEIRQAGAKNIILVPGGRWSGAHEWLKNHGGTSNAASFADLTDPLNRTWLEAHQYADSNFSGMGKECMDANRLQKIFNNLTLWAQQNKQKLFLGEFGVASDEKCLAALDAMLAGMTDETVWRGWTYWAAGAWWGNYPLSIQPKDGVDAPQTAVLKKYF